jgi:hypothetical protein
VLTGLPHGYQLRSVAPEGKVVTSLTAAAAAPTITRNQAIARAATWVNARPVVPYSQTHYFYTNTVYWGDAAGHNPAGWREDCSGFVSRAWGIASPGLTTATLPSVTTRIAWSSLQPGDALLRYDATAHHVALFVKWDDAAHTRFTLWEEANDVDDTTVDVGVTLTNSYWSTFTPIRYNRITGAATPPPPQPQPKPQPRVIAHDFTGDGKADILARDAAGRLLLYAGLGTGRLRAGRVLATGRASATALAESGDFNSDGHDDVIARNTAGTLLLLPGAGSLLRPAKQIGTGWNNARTIVGGGDFTADGVPDVIARFASGLLRLYPGNGRGGFAASRDLKVNSTAITTPLYPGDFNMDSRPDFFARDRSGAPLLFAGTGTALAANATSLGAAWTGLTAIAGVGDLSGDGRPDIVTRNTAGVLQLRPGNGANGFGVTRTAGSSWGAMTAIF